MTLPLLRGHARSHGKLALTHFDAHTDSYEYQVIDAHQARDILGGNQTGIPAFRWAPLPGSITTAATP